MSILDHAGAEGDPAANEGRVEGVVATSARRIAGRWEGVYAVKKQGNEIPPHHAGEGSKRE